MCSGMNFAAWQAECIRLLVDSGSAVPALLIFDGGANGPWGGGGRRLGSSTLWHAYNNRWSGPRSRSLRTTDLTDLLAGLPRLTVEPIRKGRFSQLFADGDVRTIEDHRLDFILRFAFGIIRGDILNAARHGIWSFHHDDIDVYRGGPPCFWEVFRRDPVTGVVLQRLTERLDGGVVLQRGWFRTVDHSHTRNRDQAYFGSAAWPTQVARSLQEGDPGHLDDEPTSSTAPILHNPTNRQMVAFLVRLLARAALHHGEQIARADQWTVGVVDTPVTTYLTPSEKPPVHWAPRQKRDRYIADPFAIEVDGALTVLVEDFDQRTAHGHIAALSVSADGRWSPARPVSLDIVGHASYPFLFEHDGEAYCVPETFESGHVTLHRAVEFPTRWEKVIDIVEDFPATDPTVFHHDGRWWLLCSERETGPGTRLFVWHAPDLLGPWEPHRRNPVKTDVRSSRPAGPPFYADGALHRPAQDGSRVYGGSVVINRITLLTTDAFEEHPVAHVDPPSSGPWTAGLHTLAGVGDRTVIDAKRRLFVWDSFRRELAGRLRKLSR